MVSLAVGEEGSEWAKFTLGGLLLKQMLEELGFAVVCWQAEVERLINTVTDDPVRHKVICSFEAAY